MGIRMSGMVSGMDTESIIKELMTTQSGKKTKIENSKTKLEWKQEKWKELNKKIYNLYTGTLSKVKMQSTYNSKSTTSSNEKAVTATADANASIGSNTVEVKNLASSQYVTGEKLSGTITAATTKMTELGMDIGTKLTVTVGDTEANKVTKEVTITEEMTINEFTSALKSSGINASYDEKQKRFFLTSTDSGTEKQFTIDDGNNGAQLKKIGLGNIAIAEDGIVTSTNTDMTLIKAENSNIIVNGATFEGSTNTISVNGVNYNLKSKTAAGESVSIGVSKNTDAIYDTVKKFVTEYNEVLKEMNTFYNADSARGYDVLTEEQRDAMTDEQIEKWENKIKDSLLRGDSTISSLTTTMKSAMMKNMTVDGKSYSLASLGIQTSSDYKENGLLHIYGDAEDSTYATETNKLKNMIDTEPDTVMNVLTELTKGLYDDLTDKMKATTLSSALTFYNDKQIKDQLSDYETEIKDWTKKLTNMENRYYDQYTAMEKALSKLQSQTSYITGMFPTS